MARSYFGGVAICYVLPVFMDDVHVWAHTGNAKRAYNAQVTHRTGQYQGDTNHTIRYEMLGELTALAQTN